MKRQPPEPKFRATCECGARQPRATTAFTTEQWMRRHATDDHPTSTEETR